jgi:hypothetical protein
MAADAAHSHVINIYGFAATINQPNTIEQHY